MSKSKSQKASRLDPPSVVSTMNRPTSYDGAVLAVFQGERNKNYVIMSSTAPIYQALDNAQAYDEGSTKCQLPFDCSNVTFYECRQRRCFRPPDAFDFNCLSPADYLRLRETHELDDVTSYASACDYEQVAHCIAVERSYWRTKPTRNNSKNSLISVATVT